MPIAHRYRLRVPVLGIATLFQADSVELIEAVRRAYAGHGSGDDDTRADPARTRRAGEREVPVCIRLRMMRGAGAAAATTSAVRCAGGDRAPDAGTARGDGAAGPPVIGVAGGRLTLDAADARGTADLARREAHAEIAASLLDDPQRLTEDVLDTLTLFLLTRLGRTPVHAAGIVLPDGTAAVLAGPSGAGKSSLALAALRAGLRVLSEDAVYVRTEPTLRVWGLPRAIHVLPEAASAVSEAPLRLRRGRWKHAVPAGSGAWAGYADRAVLCVAGRGEGPASLEPMEVEDAVREVMAQLEPGFDDFRAGLPDLLRTLAAGGAWRLTLSADAAEGVAAVARGLGTGLPESSALRSLQ